MNKSLILIIDDEPSYLTLLKGLLQDEGYINIITEENPLNIEHILKNFNVELIITDIYMPQMNGLELLEKVNNSHPQIPIIVITGVGDTEIALQAVKLGAYEFITKPPDTGRLFLTIERALEQHLLKLERDSLRLGLSRPRSITENFNDIITESQNMYKIFELVEIFAPTNETVLIAGETGTGKDMIAKKIHDLSPRKNKPFIAVNLAAISPNLFESELFGCEKGAFTGAAADKKGYFEAADEGTLFLDEIGELPKELQGKLLRTIQYNEIYRIGSPKPIKLDIRILSATNKDLMQAVQENQFRADLYYRLNRGFIFLPPLKERREDIFLLATHFLERGNKTYKKNIPGFSDAVILSLKKYSFPGNVRELENIIINAVAKNKADEPIAEINLPKNTNGKEADYFDKFSLMSMDEVSSMHIKHVLDYTKGNVQQAALILGISERTLQRRIKPESN
ncbi:MAG TPA: sigma-54 dependent transcriptional regulator [Ignavibacteriaceae bacterium]|nr:sigma-54 dependent transcriptional regulator [Ignavibacteriaceae bacterium]